MHPSESSSPTLPSATCLPIEVTEHLRKRQVLVRETFLAIDRNRWCLFSCLLAILLLVALAHIIILHQQFANHVKVAWVKLQPNGTWDIDFFDENREVEFFPATIDYMLSQFVIRRYSKIAHSIRADYGFSQQLMAPQLSQAFVSPSQFNAPQVAADFIACGTCGEIHIAIRNIDHFESQETLFAKLPGTLYRTNMFVRETMLYADSSIKQEANRIITITWRLKNKQEIQANKSLLQANPIGLEIISSDYLEDPTSSQPSAQSATSVKEPL